MTIKEHYTNFMNTHFPVSRLVATQPYVVIIKATNYCWYKCAHCCEKSGPDQPRKYIPIESVRGIIDNVTADPSFTRHFVFTGGEIMTIYQMGDTKYVKNVLDYSLGHNCDADIKTNAAWTRTTFGQRIFDDLADVSNKHTPYMLQVSLSLDKFHKNAVENNARFIAEMAQRESKIIVHLSGLDGRWYVTPDVIYDELKKYGIKLEGAFGTNNNQTKIFPTQCANESVVIIHDTGTLFDGGRGADICGATRQPTPQFQIINNNDQLLFAYDSMGRLTVGEAGFRKIGTRWANANGTIRDMADIRRCLMKSAMWEEMRYAFISR